MKTIFKFAEDVGGGDKIIVDGIVKEVYDADYVVPEYESTVRIEMIDGDVLMYGAVQSVEVVEE